MIKKNYTKTGKLCRVTFKLPKEVNAEMVALCGDFNKWDTHSSAMKRLKDGSFSITITLPTAKKYRFKYFLDSKHWENDWEADGYTKNAYGSEDSIIKV